MNLLSTIKQRTFLRILLYTLAVIAVPFFLISTNVRLAVNSPRLYDYGFNKYEIMEKTNIASDQLREAGQQIRDYFNSDENFLTVRVLFNGVYVYNLYNTREVLHMKDVKSLIRGIYLTQSVTGIYLIAFAAAVFLIRRKTWFAEFSQCILVGCGITLAIVLLAGVSALVDFDRLFLTFHLVSFTNDLWQLDPKTDYLIAMFPQEFFLDATILIAVATVLESLVLGAVCIGLKKLTKSVQP